MNLTNGQKIISIILIALIVLLLILLYIQSVDVAPTIEKVANEIETVVEKPKTLIEICSSYDVEYLKRDGNDIYVTFGFQLYDEDGSSNEIKIKNLINDLTDYFKANFHLIDEQNNININVFYKKTGDNEYFINNQIDFFETTDGKTYYDINNVDIVPQKNIYVSDPTLQILSVKSLRYSDLVKTLGEPVGTDEDGYLLFDDGNIRVSKYEESNMVRNMIYSEKYLNSFVSKIKDGYSLNAVVQAYGEPTFGSLNEGYVGYRNSDYYMFFYDDEISVYGYGYSSNIEFEKVLKQFRTDLDVKKLSLNVTSMWGGYYKHELDAENGNLYISYPSRGVEINIKNLNYKGITFYSNYFFTDELLEKIKNGEYTLNADEDFIHIVEQERVGK